MSNTLNDITLFTSESVCAGHPDKICDAISDAIVDSALAQDPNSRCGVEAVVGSNQICLFGEIKTRAKIDYEKIARSTVKKLGYSVPEWGFSQKSSFRNALHEQSPEIALGVDQDGAGDQGMMFGFACRETPELMPLPIAIAHSLTKKIDELRENGQIDWLRPDGKTQVTVAYKKGKPVSIEKLVAAVAHSEETKPDKVRSDIIEKVLKPVTSKYGFELPKDENIIINGTGLWHMYSSITY